MDIGACGTDADARADLVPIAPPARTGIAHGTRSDPSATILIADTTHDIEAACRQARIIATATGSDSAADLAATRSTRRLARPHPDRRSGSRDLRRQASAMSLARTRCRQG